MRATLQSVSANQGRRPTAAPLKRPTPFRCLNHQTHQSIDFNAADTEMAVALEALPNVGTVSVSRTGPDGQLGYEWKITFLDNPGSFPPGSGNVADLTADFSSLEGVGADCAVSEESSGSLELSGAFVLKFTSSADSGSNNDASGGEVQYTTELAYNALAEEVRKSFFIDGIGRGQRHAHCVGTVADSVDFIEGNYSRDLARQHPIHSSYQHYLTAEVNPVSHAQRTGKQVEASLEALDHVGNVIVTRATNTDGFTWTVTFASCLRDDTSGFDVCNIGDVEMIAFEDSSGVENGSLSGCSGEPSVSAMVMVEGSAGQAVDMVDLSDGPPYR